MARTPSNMMPLGTVAPDFLLPDVVSGQSVSLADLKSDKATVVMFICNHCPYVILLKEKLVELAKHYQAQGVSFIAISSNDAQNYPQDGPVPMKADAAKYGYTFPYLYDETQEIAQAYDAACTPDIFVFDENMQCAYRGQFDSARPAADIEPTGEDLAAALDAILAGEPVNEQQKPSMGCNIKWRKATLT